MAQSYELMGEAALRALVQGLQNAPETDGADSVLVLDGGKLRGMPFANLAEMIATGVIFTVVPTPSDAKVTINGKVCERAFVECGTEVEWSVEKDGYVTKTGSQVVTENTTIEVDLAEGARFTIVPTPEDADVYINGEKTTSLVVEKGTEVEWEVSADGYVSQSGTEVVTEDVTKAVTLEAATAFTFVYDSNSMYIYRGTAMGSSTTGLFSIDGDYDIEINGVLIENVTGSTTFGSEYLNATGNIVKIYPHEGTTINHRYDGVTTNATRNQTRYISEIVSWGLATFGDVSYMFALGGTYSTLKKVPKLTAGFAGVTSFDGMFRYCGSITELADGLFDNCPNVTTFSGCFYGCTGLTSIPTGLFDNCPSATTFQSCFQGCTGLTSIPTGLFDNCPSATTFSGCFQGCTGLTSIPTGLFDNCPSATTFSSCFQGCTGLTTLPAGLFEGCPSATTFYGCFYGCTGLTTLPENLFINCTKVTNFSYCFRGCTGLTTLPENLFINCTKVTNFSYCFHSGSSSTHNLEGESAFDRVEIDGVETVIHLYERENYPDLYTAPSSTSYCYLEQTKLDDYDAIPSGWK